MFAVIETGGKQYIALPSERLTVEKIPGQKGDKVVFNKVLLFFDGKKTVVGTPYIKGAKVEAEVADQFRDKKKIVFRYHSKTRYRKLKGHRQHQTKVKIISLEE